jgi:hypothetical protein
MRSERYELYYDVKPPSNLLPSWRDTTTRPGRERPDLTIFDIYERRAILVDVKFSEVKGWAKGDHLSEVQTYLHSFGLARGGIVYPATNAEVRVHDGSGMALIEVPLLPSKDLDITQHLEMAIEDLWTPIPPLVSGTRVTA